MFFYDATITVDNILDSIYSHDCIEECANALEKALKTVDFQLNDKFYDSKSLSKSWYNTKIPKEFLTFFFKLFNVDVT